MWHDNETSIDLLGFDYLSRALIDVLSERRLLPVTVGVFGDWGSGKSSLMRIARDELGANKRTATIEFSAWQFEGYEDVKAALMQVILQRLQSEEGLSEKARGLRDRLLKRVDWFYAIGLAAGRIATLTPPTLDELRRAVRPEESGEAETQAIQEFRSDFAALLAEIEELDVLVVFIDDLDRCLPTSIIETFEAIRLFLAVPKTAFVIAADERIIRFAIGSRYPPDAGGRVDLGRDYLEKIVQVPIRIPPLTGSEVEAYLNLLFAELHLPPEIHEALRGKATEARAADTLAVACNYGIAAGVVDPVPEPLQSSFELSARIAPILAGGLNGNPRQLKRFMNALVLRQKAAAARGVDLDAAVLAKLMILEYLHEVQFRTLFEWQAVSDGRPPELAAAERAVAEGEEPGSEAGAFADPALRTWLQLDPTLADVDLQPYFYFSRDRIEITAPGRRLPRELQEVLARLESESDTFRAEAIEKAVQLPEGELRALYEALSDRYLRVPSAPHLGDSLIDIAAGRQELAPALISVLSAVQPVSIVPRVALRLGEKLPTPEARRLLTKWSSQKEAKQLATSAMATLKRIEKATD
jgi:predicted KAP-like P-loop ATPase